MKKSKIALIGVVIATAFLTIGCGADSKLERGIDYLNDGRYEEASKIFEEVLKKNPKNEEAKNLEEILKDYKEAQDKYNEGKFKEAKDILDSIPESYNEFNIKNNIDELNKNIEAKLKLIEENGDKLNEVERLLNENKLSDVDNKIKEIQEETLTEEQKAKLNSLKESLVKKQEENKKILEEQKKKEEEEKKKLEEQKKKEEDLKKSTKEDSNNKNNNSNKGQVQKPATANRTYVSKNLGIQMEIPASWAGYYEVSEYEDGLVFEYINKSNPEIVGTICRVEKEVPGEYNFMDSTITKTINGQKYLIGTNTDVGTNACDIDMNIYNHFKKIQKQFPLVANTLSSTK